MVTETALTSYDAPLSNKQIKYLKDRDNRDQLLAFATTVLGMGKDVAVTLIKNPIFALVIGFLAVEYANKKEYHKTWVSEGGITYGVTRTWLNDEDASSLKTIFAGSALLGALGGFLGEVLPG